VLPRYSPDEINREISPLAKYLSLQRGINIELVIKCDFIQYEKQRESETASEQGVKVIQGSWALMLVALILVKTSLYCFSLLCGDTVRHQRFSGLQYCSAILNIT
jgi:hypothetical protein